MVLEDFGWAGTVEVALGDLTIAVMSTATSRDAGCSYRSAVVRARR